MSDSMDLEQGGRQGLFGPRSEHSSDVEELEPAQGSDHKDSKRGIFGRLMRLWVSTSPVKDSPAETGIDPSNSPRKPPYTDRENDEACTKLWEIYAGEAERYDKALVSSWKEDMDVTLVFSGLYSAVLTAFIIESYTSLQPDSGDTTVILLQQISEQLSAAANGTKLTLPDQQPFHVPISSLICNILWFLSLALALACAFLATFVQQWTRQFLHKTNIRPSSLYRARMFSFLYFGLKEFRMHALVDIIPSLLHLSLFFFFGGLIAFLHPVHRALIWLTSTALAVLLILYFAFTILPLIKLNSPYQTPISPLLWRLWNYSHELLRKSNPQSSESTILLDIVDAVVHKSYHGDRKKRDSLSVAWTIESLTDDAELLPFIEALPDVIYGPLGLRNDCIHLLRPLLETKDPQRKIIGRIQSLMDNMQSPRFGDEHRKRCKTACPKALWSIAYILHMHSDLFDQKKTGNNHWFSSSNVKSFELGASGENFDPFYAIPAWALMESMSEIQGYTFELFLIRSLDCHLPYEFHPTCKALWNPEYYDDGFSRMLLSNIFGRIPSVPAVQEIDHIFTASLLACTWDTLHYAFRYIAKRHSREALGFIWNGCNRNELADCVPHFCQIIFDRGLKDEEDWQAIWALGDAVSFWVGNKQTSLFWSKLLPLIREQIQTGFLSSHYWSILSMAQIIVLHNLEFDDRIRREAFIKDNSLKIDKAHHHWQDQNTAIEYSITNAFFAMCTDQGMPFKAGATVEWMTRGPLSPWIPAETLAKAGEQIYRIMECAAVDHDNVELKCVVNALWSPLQKFYARSTSLDEEDITASLHLYKATEIYLDMENVEKDGENREKNESPTWWAKDIRAQLTQLLDSRLERENVSQVAEDEPVDVNVTQDATVSASVSNSGRKMIQAVDISQPC